MGRFGYIALYVLLEPGTKPGGVEGTGAFGTAACSGISVGIGIGIGIGTAEPAGGAIIMGAPSGAPIIMGGAIIMGAPSGAPIIGCGMYMG